MSRTLIYDLGARRVPGTIGGKAENLRFLIRNGLKVPVSYVCTWDAYVRYRAGDPELVSDLQSGLYERLNMDCAYAVRSSANIEDGHEHSFAGQFETQLGVQGMVDILEAMQSIWAAALDPGVQAYLEKSGLDPGELRMAVIIQEMVQPHLSGVSFSKNPMTGMDEVIVEAVRGSGEALVQEGITPMRWINKWGSWIQVSDDQAPELSIIGDVVQQTKEIAKKHGSPVDLEWVYDGEAVRWVQLREITTLDVPVYSNRIASEVFPGIIKPLVWSVNVPLVNGAWTRLLSEVTGSCNIDPESLASLFSYRAYFNMSAMGQIFEMLGLPRETLELVVGLEVEGPEKPTFRPSSKTYSLMPRMLLFALDKLRFGNRLDRCLPEQEEQFRAFDQAVVAEMNESEILEAIDGLFELAQEMAYCNIVTPLLMHLYNRMLRVQLERAGLDSANLDVTSGMEELREFEPDVHLSILKVHYDKLEPDLKRRIAESSYEEFCLLPSIVAFQKEVGQFIDRFGHLSDSGNDFSSVPWRENPDLILRMIVDYEPTQARNRRKTGFHELDLPLHRRVFISPTYRSARRFRWYREAVSSLYTFGYGLFRNLFLALGDHFASRDVIVLGEDIFYLYDDEVREIAASRTTGLSYKTTVETRKDEIEKVRKIEPPSIIYGDRAPATLAPKGNKLDGIPTSRGQYTGRARVLRGIEDFAKLEVGDVLVIPYSDVGWTPLFAKAGAVVAESGGILSHSSIVAREYDIPAVVSVSGACRLQDDTLVTVDGYSGIVMVHESETN